MNNERKTAIKRLRDCPEFLNEAALWFSRKWDIPFEAYCKSIEACIDQKNGIPQWYIVLNGHGDIVAGAGVIENDFHQRKDLTPNVCALFVETAYRNRGLALDILNFIRRDLYQMGFLKIYLITDHTEFYEKCGWEFMFMVTSDDNTQERMYTAPPLV